MNYQERIDELTLEVEKLQSRRIALRKEGVSVMGTYASVVRKQQEAQREIRMLNFRLRGKLKTPHGLLIKAMDSTFEQIEESRWISDCERFTLVNYFYDGGKPCNPYWVVYGGKHGTRITKDNHPTAAEAVNDASLYVAKYGQWW